MKETQQKILDAAIKAIANHGFDRANVNTIAKAAGFSIGTFYNYFPSKRNLMVAIIEKISQRHVVHIQETVTPETDPERQMAEFFEAGFSFIEDNLHQARAIFNTLNGPDEAFKSQLFQAYQPLFGLLGDILALGIDQGVFQCQDPDAVVRLIMLIYLGVGAQVNPEGRHWLKPAQVSGFILDSLQVPEKER